MLTARWGAPAFSPPKMIATATNPEPERLPTLGVWTDEKSNPGHPLTMVSAAFPNVPGFICDSWCYESALEFLGAHGLDGGTAGAAPPLHGPNQRPLHHYHHARTRRGRVPGPRRLRRGHRSSHCRPISLLPTCAGNCGARPVFAVRLIPIPSSSSAVSFSPRPGRTFLDRTVRRKIPVRPADDRYNNPPWVQMYVGDWQAVPAAGTNSWADYSPDRYTTRVIGAVSRDGRYLAAIANDSATGMCQAWHDCMHNNAQWTPAEAPPAQRRWRVKIYVMENDPEALLQRVNKDFPAAREISAAAGAKEFETAGVRDRLPVFYERLASRMDYPLSWLSGGQGEFAAWREKARAKVMECLLLAPPAAPFEPKVIAEQDRGSYVARKVVFNVTGDSRVLAFLLVPKSAGPHPAVLLLHDHGAKFDIGKEKVIEPWDEPPQKMESARKWIIQYYGGRFIGDELAKRGYVCLATDMLNWSDRGGGGYENQQALAANLFQFGASWAGLIAHEDLRAAEFLATRPEVDAKRVAAMGLSVGGYRTWQTAALSDRIAAGVSVCWMATRKGLMVPRNNQTTGQSAFTMIHPGLANLLDYPDVASIACPKPMMFLCGGRDQLFPAASIEEAFGKMRRVWESQKAADRLVTRLYDAPHEFNATMQDDAFDWLDRQIKPVR